MKLSELKAGDWVLLNDEGVEREGTVLRVSAEDKMVCVNNGVQEFWFDIADIKPIPLTEKQLFNLGFERIGNDNPAKYGKGAFRVAFPAADNFSQVEAWYREDRRVFDRQLMVHELQNIHLQMTKVQLQA